MEGVDGLFERRLENQGDRQNDGQRQHEHEQFGGQQWGQLKTVFSGTLPTS